MGEGRRRRAGWEGCTWSTEKVESTAARERWYDRARREGREGMSTVVIQQGPDLRMTADIRVPGWVQELASFRRWTDSDDFPEDCRISYLDGEIWVDMSKEQLFSHNRLKAQMSAVLEGLVRERDLGYFFVDGVRLSPPEANLSQIPDALFFSWDTYERGRVRLIEGAAGGFNEIEGSPDMILEVVSDSSVHKDTVLLKERYGRAGIPEYWLVDARGDLKFDLFRHTARGYVARRKQDGWLRSDVFGKSFRLTQQADALGNPSFTLDVR
jgi:Uma2 family endonuclease